MAFKSITDQQIDRGRGAKNELFQQISDNLDDLNERIGQTGGESANVFNTAIIGLFPDDQIIGIYRTSRPVILQECLLTIMETFNDAAEEVIMDVLHGTTTDIAAATSIFKTKPKVQATAGQASGGTEFTDDLGELEVGTYLFLKVDQYQENVGASHIILR